MANRRLTYQIGVTADTNQFQAAIKEALSSLSNLSTQSSMVPSLQQASTAALELKRNLESAMNVKGDSIDLTKFNDNLKNSNRTLTEYYRTLEALGPSGQEAFLSVANAIMKAETPLRRTSKLMDELWITMKNTMRWQLTSSVLHGFIGQLETAYGYAKSLDTSLNNIRIVTLKSTDEMKEFAAYANEAAKALSTTTTDYTDASLIYYQQGLDDEQVKGRTETTIKMANVSRQAAEEVSEQLTAVWNNFYEEGGKSLEYYADVMVALGAATASSSDEIATGLQKFAAVAGTVGLSYEYAATALATLTSITRESANVVGTALRTLFSRFQGLSLGETLEDGIDLNKYSKALDAVGVKILDANGNLKQMDDILDETAAKWDNLTKAQQMALAQTVAGVRQYTQFISLMDNWDTFETNLATATSATGALDEQADIYAESWEGARDRVKAATEDIYDSLINPDFFIGVDDAVTPILSGTADVIDAMGGMQGVLAGLALLMNRVYGDQMASGMRAMATNLGLMQQKEWERAQALRQEAADMARLISLQSSDNSIDNQRISQEAKLVELQGQANAYELELSSYQAEKLRSLVQEAAVRQDILDTMAQQTNQARQQAEILTERLTEHMNQESQRNWRDQIRGATFQRDASGNLTNRVQQGMGVIKKDVNAVLNDSSVNSNERALVALIARLKEAAIQSEKYRQLQRSLSQSTSGISQESIELARSLGLVAQSMPDDQVEIYLSANGRFNTELQSSTERVNRLRQVILALGEDNVRFQNDLTRLVAQFRTGTVSEQAFNDALTQMERKMQEAQNAMSNGSLKAKDWAETLVNAGTVLSQVTMGINALQSLGRVFSDEDMSNTERFVTILTSLSMLLPTLSMAFGALNKERQISVVLGGQAALVETKTVSATLASAIAKKLSAKATSDDTAKTIANTAAKYANNLILLAAVAAVAALTVAIYAAVKAYNADADAAKKAAEAARETAESADEAKRAADELRSSIDAYDSAVQKLEECTEGTQEWRDALKEVNEAAIEVLNNAGKLSAEDLANLRNSDGTLNRDALTGLQDRADQRAENLAYAASAAEKYAADMQLRADAMALGRKAYSSRDEVSDSGDRDILLANYEELAKLSKQELVPALRKLGFSISDSEDTIDTWYTAIQDMADSAVAAGEKFNLITQMQVEQVLGVAQTTLDKAVQSMVTGQIDALTQELTDEWEDKLTGSGINKASGSGNSIYQETLRALQDAGYDVSAQTDNAVRGTDNNRSLAFLNSQGQEVIYNDEQIAAMIAAAQALDEIGDSAQGAKTQLQDLDEGALNYIAQGDFSNSLRDALADYDTAAEVIEQFGGEEAIKAIIAAQQGISIDEVGEELVNEFVDGVVNAAENTRDDMDNVGKEYARSVQQALEGADLSNLTLSEMQDVADIFALASAYGKLDEAIAAYEAGSLEEFAEGIKEVVSSLEDFQTKYAAIRKVIDDIATGDTISKEDYDTLGEGAKQYFTMMLDGTYKLTANAAEFKEATQQALLDEATKNMDTLEARNQEYRNLQGYDFNNLTKQANYQDENGDWKYNHTTVQQQLDIIRLLGDQTDETKMKLDEWYQDLAAGSFDDGLDEIAQMVGECSGAFNGLSDTIAANEEEARAWNLAIASSYDNLGDLKQALDDGIISTEAYTQAAINLDRASDTEMLDPEEWEDFADYLRTSADEMEGLNDEMSDNEARIVAKGIMKMNDAIEDLSNNLEDWSDIIQNSSEDSEEFAEAMQDCRTAVANLLDVSEDYVSNDFISQNLDLIEQAATGSATAIDSLKSKLGNDIIARIVVENGLSEDETATILTDYQSLVALIPDIDVGVSLDDGEFLTKAQQLITDAGMTVDQVNALFDAMGFEANFKTEPVLTKQRVPEYVTETIDAGTYEDDNGNTVIRTRTRTYQDGYYEAEGYVDAIAMTTNGKTPVIDGITKKATGNYNNYSSKNAGGGSPGGGGSSSKPKQIDKEEGNAEPERYHRINRVIEAQERELEEIGTQIDRAYGSNKLALFTKREQELNTQFANQNTKLEEANEWLKKDQKALQDFLSTSGNDAAIFDEDGEIANFDRLQANELAYYESSLNAYNAYIETYNAMSATKQEAAADELEAQQAAFEAAEKRWTKWQDLVSQYEDTLDIVNEQQQILLDGLRELSDLKLQEIDYKLEIVLDIKSMKDSIDEFWKEFYETQGDYLSHFKMYEKLSADLAGREANMFGDYVEKWQSLQEMLSDPYADEEAVMEDIQELQSQILDSAAAIVEWADTIEEIIPEAVSAAADRFAKFTDQLDHNTSVLETIKELYALQGVTNKTASGFATLQRNLGERLEAQTANAVLNKKWADEARQRLAQAQAELDAYLAAGGQEGTNEHDRLLKARDAYLEEFNEAQEAYLSLAQEAMETAQEMYIEQIERAVYEFGQAASNGLGLDLLQDKYDHYIEAEQRYLDKVNEAYQVTFWYNKLQKDIDEATSASTRERLKTLQEEIDLRREGGKLSQYDLEILEAKYKVMQAQIALEDAQNAKNNLQLVRDRQGNWNYQYTADPSQVEQAEQDLITAQNEWYNIAKEQVTNVTGEIVGLWQECSDAVAEIYNDMTLTDQERADRAAEIYAYYTDKIKYLEEEKQVAVSDMTEAGNESLLTNAILMGDTITDLTGLTSEEIQQIVEDSGGSIISILSGNNETIKDIVASNTELIDLFENKYAEDLELMTGNTETFETDLRGLLDQCEGNFQSYQDKVEDVARETGTTLGDLADETDIVSDATDELRSRGEEAAVALWGQIDAAAALSAELSLLAEQYLAVAQAMAQLAAEQAAQVEQSYVEDTVPEVPEITTPDTPNTSQTEPTGVGTGGAMSANQMSQLVYDMGLGLYNNNPVRRQQVESMYPGMHSVAQSILNDALAQDRWNYEHNGTKWKDTVDRLVREAGFDTGGYTGEFDNARLAFLHEKELVLNQEDTNNILAAVNTVRMLGPEFFAAIERALDSSVAAGMGLMKERISGSSSIQSVGDTLQQDVRIEAVFPNATDRNEIAEALSNLTNDASQYIRRRRD